VDRLFLEESLPNDKKGNLSQEMKKRKEKKKDMREIKENF
jgi:hypothetical protein